MTLAIGDIHGCYKALDTMLELVQPSTDDLIITLGDYVDRGPDSSIVIATLLKLKQTHNYIHLMGNHEIQMIRALEAPHHMERFLSSMCGGQETLNNYGGSFEDIPKDHWDFITTSKLYHETDSHIYVHAGVDSHKAMDKQDPETLYYKRFHEAKAHQSGKPYLCGHSIQGDLPTNLGFAICLDTCAYGGGWLTALDTDSGKCYQTNESGKSREITI
ncbi:metallophosphoesterase [Akkermansiaceae bacterium]|nr:metallophosphoesterase [Akkermansiaceae bacterium]